MHTHVAMAKQQHQQRYCGQRSPTCICDSPSRRLLSRVARRLINFFGFRLLLAAHGHAEAEVSAEVPQNDEPHQQYLYDCPAQPVQTKAKNDNVPGYFAYHIDNSVRFHEDGEDADPANYYLTGFRSSRHGGHHYPYSEYKEMVRHWRSALFGDELESGDIIYEGAGSEGFNLLMTAEILREDRDIEGLTIYGHDYLVPFVRIANRLFDKQTSSGATTGNGNSWIKKGRYCQGDSTDLHFVPSNSFDLAYTNIDVLVDGLGRLGDNMDDEERCAEMIKLCFSDDEKDQEIVAQDQALQEQWHSSWVKELVRIVKPGKVVVIENVCGPICDKHIIGSPWGGVDPEWWKKAAVEYRWDVDIDSVSWYSDSWFRDAYHVVMRKKEDTAVYVVNSTKKVTGMPNGVEREL